MKTLLYIMAGIIVLLLMVILPDRWLSGLVTGLVFAMFVDTIREW